MTTMDNDALPKGAKEESADEKFTAIQAVVAQSPITSDIIDSGLAVLRDKTLSASLGDKAKLAIALAHATPAGDMAEAPLLMVWETSHLAWANAQPHARHNIKAALSADIKTYSRFAKIAADLRWQVTTMQFADILKKVANRTHPQTATRLRGLMDRFGSKQNELKL